MKMPDNKRKTVGNLGEKAACKFLKKNKYKIIETNFSNKYGEVDIICENKEYIVFVEVKTRSKDGLDSGVYAVNKTKQHHIIKTAHTFLQTYITDKQPRFDIIEVKFDSDKNSYTIADHYIDAFSQGGYYAVF